MYQVRKRKLFELLHKQGLSIKRTATSGVKSWTASDGETFKSLEEAYRYYINKERIKHAR